jgi:pyruvate/2-oxoglutarate dehydrogenase complex dihydrolipoamide acyltransferase (E2) component
VAEPEVAGAELRFPDLGQGDGASEPGVVATWFAEDGEAVAAGQLLVEVQVGKIAAEVHAPCSGVLHRLQPEGVPLEPGSLIGRVN